MDEDRKWPERRGVLHNLLIYGAYQAWALMAGSFVYFMHLNRVSPRSSDSVSGRTFEMSNHGDLFYVRPAQNILFQGTLFGGVAVFFIMVLIVTTIFGRSAASRFYPVHFAVAAILAWAFWQTASALTA